MKEFYCRKKLELGKLRCKKQCNCCRVSHGKNSAKRLYNFHKDNKWDILKALATNYIYACFMIGVPVAIFIGNTWLVFLALLGAYTMLTVVINRPRYETLYGRTLMVVACTMGGMTSYILGEWIKTLL